MLHAGAALCRGPRPVMALVIDNRNIAVPVEVHLLQEKAGVVVGREVKVPAQQRSGKTAHLAKSRLLSQPCIQISLLLHCKSGSKLSKAWHDTNQLSLFSYRSPFASTIGVPDCRKWITPAS